MGADDDMTCRELVELLTDYLEGGLPDRDRARFEAHLAECDRCMASIEQMRTTIRLTGMLTLEQVPAEGREALLAVFRAWRASSRT